MAKIFSVHTPAEVKNSIINGNFDFWERYTSFTAIATNAYSADRWYTTNTNVGSLSTLVDRSALVPNTGAPFSMRTYISANALGAPGSTALMTNRYGIEGVDLLPLLNKISTLSFWVKTNKPGTYSVAFQNSGSDRTCVQQFTITGSNTWEFKTIQIPAPPTTGGTWNLTNGAGMYIYWGWCVGSSFQTATLGQWQSGNFLAGTSQTNMADTIGNEVFLSQVMINEGTLVAPFQRAGKDIQQELSLCQRYHETMASGAYWQFGVGHSEGTAFYAGISWKTNKRTSDPTLTFVGGFEANQTGGVNALSGLAKYSAWSGGAMVNGTTSALTGVSEFRANSSGATIRIEADF